MRLVAFFIIGALAGVISGMGIGGGAVLIPCLCIFMKVDQRTAQNVNLIYFLPTAAIALITHIKNKNVEKNPAFAIILYGLPFAVAGSFMALKAGQETLRSMFGYFLLVVAMYELFGKEQNNQKNME